MEVVVYHVGIGILWSLPPIGDPVPGCRDHRMPVFKYQHRYDRRLVVYRSSFTYSYTVTVGISEAVTDRLLPAYGWHLHFLIVVL